MERVNRILDDVEVITETVSRPVEGMSSLIAGVRQGAGIIKVLSKLFKGEEENEEGEE